MFRKTNATASRCVALVVLTLLATFAVMAAPLGPSSGFLGTYLGPHNDDLDIQAGEAFFDGTNYTFDATLKGAVGTTPGFYVWGVNRGANLPLFGSFAPGVLFDAVVIFFGGGGGGVIVDFANKGAQTPIPAADVTISGNSIDGVIPAADLPSLGLFLPSQYKVNLWTRDGLDATMNSQIAQFDPPDSDVPVTTPEPAAAGLVALGLGVAALTRRRRAV